jgi:hypothetical protein
LSENNTLQLEYASDLAAVQRNFEQLLKQQVGRGPAQARVYNNANLSLTTGTLTALTFNSERWDTGNFHSTSVNTGRLVAPTAGLYEIGGSVQFASNGTGTRDIRIRLNGSTALAIDIWTAIAGGSVQPVQVTTVYQLAAGDYVELLAAQTSGGNLNVEVAANYSPEFWIVRLGSQA